MGNLGNTLRQRLRKLSSSIAIDQLVRRGVKEVNVVGLDHIVALIEEAVRRTLRSKLMGLDRDQVAGATREEFLRLLKSKEVLERSRDEAVKLKEQAEEQIDQLRRQIAESHNQLREELALAERDLRARYQGEDAAIVTKVNEIFTALAGKGSATTVDLRDHVIALVLDLVGHEREDAVQARQASHDREIDRLERRIVKLKGNLQETETRLVKIANLKSIDPGISSIYREVQGIDAADMQVQRKQLLMTDIFKANLALQKPGAKKSS